MIRLLVVVALLILGGCAGHAEYRIRPYIDPTTHETVCCEAIVKSSRDVQSVVVHASKDAAGGYTLDLTEIGISASAPIQAQSSTITGVSNAISNAAAAAVRFTP